MAEKDTPASPDDELLIHLDTAGLAKLLKSVGAAMVGGRGHLALGLDCGMTARRGGSDGRFAKVTVKFGHHVGPFEGEGPSDPEPLPGLPVLELQD